MGAENRNHPPRPCPSRHFCHADMRPVHTPSWERPLLVDCAASWPEPKGGGSIAVTLSFCLGPSEAVLHQLGGLGWSQGMGERSLSQGKLMPS